MSSWWTRRDTLFAVVYVIVVGFVGFGALRPDPYLQNNEVDHGPLLYLVRYGTYAALCLLFYAVAAIYCMRRSGRMPAKVLKTGLVAVALLALIFYVPVSYVYERTLMPRADFHPYLQLFPRGIPQELADRDDNTLLVVCIGGSTTEFGDPDGRDWPSRVESQLSAQFPDKTIRVLNQGRAWYNTQHALLNYELNIRALHPDVIVVMHAINDLMVNAVDGKYTNGTFRQDYGHHYGPLARLARNRPLFDMLWDTIGSMWYWTPREVIETDKFPGLKPYRRNLERLIQLARLDGSEIVLMTQPYLYKEEMTKEEQAAIWIHTHNCVGYRQRWSIATARHGMEKYNGCVRELAEQFEVPLVELEPTVPKSLEYFIDDCHFAPPAFDLIAADISKRLADVLLTTVPIDSESKPKQSNRIGRAIPASK